MLVAGARRFGRDPDTVHRSVNGAPSGVRPDGGTTQAVLDLTSGSHQVRGIHLVADPGTPSPVE
ncbi:hypothetical protein [Streptomyces sp. NBC_00103]|uniref:hypothetical protein n=1 Tax=Streptomyces sp. NBC_00103 TaxID=2975653 RepID=UPI002257DB5C|nr:hypothetical protein [Streptomyces sp. NBC_00103]MCX5372790.1 hypothetical protein [Streptomyces sp. NBC_00103]